MSTTARRSVALVTLGCTRNEVDSEELAGRLAAEGWQLVADAEDADVAVVNTCGFVEQAKKDSIDVLLEASSRKGEGRTRAVVAVGCLAERYGQELADALPEADAVLGFDSYAQMSGHLTAILDGHRPASHVPGDRRRRLPISPASRQASAGRVALPGHGDPAAGAGAGAGADAGAASRAPAGSGAPAGSDAPGGPAPSTRPPRDEAPLAGPVPASGPRVIRARLDGRPWAPLKIASGCDRRCAFCAIPSFRGAFVSRPPEDVLAEARWLAERGVRELFLVSENSTSYGKDLGDLGLLERLLPELAAVDGVERVRVSYLQPAEVRPALLDAVAGTPGVVPYFDLSFQHASVPLLRRMRRFGGREAFLALLGEVRARAPRAGIRTNVIVGFPGETEADVAELEAFLVEARLDAVGVFGYSDEDGTEAATLDGTLEEPEIRARVERLSSLVEELTTQRAEDRIGEEVEVLVEEVDHAEGTVLGRAAHQGPDVDGETTLAMAAGGPVPALGDLVRARVLATEGIDLVAEPW